MGKEDVGDDDFGTENVGDTVGFNVVGVVAKRPEAEALCCDVVCTVLGAEVGMDDASDAVESEFVCTVVGEVIGSEDVGRHHGRAGRRAERRNGSRERSSGVSQWE
jgi:hypothetical protein